MRPTVGLIIVAFLAAPALAGCKSKRLYPSYGLVSYEIRMDEEDVGGLYGGAKEHIEYPARVLIEGIEYRATVAAAGATTVRSPRKSLTVRLQGGDRYRGAKEIRLAAAVGDRTMLRPIVGFAAFRDAGIPASWTESAFVHLNERILGVYAAIESIEDEFFENRGIAWSRIFEAKGDADFGPVFEGRLDRAFDSVPEPANLEAMRKLLRARDEPDDDAFLAAVFRVLDRDAVVNYMAATQILHHFDGYNKNLFYYVSRSDGLMRFVPWDLDLLWTERSGEAWSRNVLFSRIGEIASVRAEIDARIAALLAGSLSKSALLARVDDARTEIAEAYAHDPWLGGGGASLDDEVDLLKRAISERIDGLP